MNISVQLDTSKVSKYLLAVAEKHMPYAMAKGLTRTAQDAQARVRSTLPTRFSIRNTWVSQGIRITAARKTKLESSVLTKDQFMALQESGGTKKPRHSNIAIPTDNARRNKKDIIPRSARPGALKEKATYFIGEVKGINGLWKRPPKGQARAARKKGGSAAPKLMFAFKHSARVQKRFGFENTVTDVANQRLSINLDAAINEAIK